MDIVSILNLVNLEFHKSVAGCRPNLLVNFTYLKYLDEVDPLKSVGLL